MDDREVVEPNEVRRHLADGDGHAGGGPHEPLRAVIEAWLDAMNASMVGMKAGISDLQSEIRASRGARPTRWRRTHTVFVDIVAPTVPRALFGARPAAMMAP